MVDSDVAVPRLAIEDVPKQISRIFFGKNSQPASSSNSYGAPLTPAAPGSSYAAPLPALPAAPSTSYGIPAASKPPSRPPPLPPPAPRPHYHQSSAAVTSYLKDIQLLITLGQAALIAFIVLAAVAVLILMAMLCMYCVGGWRGDDRPQQQPQQFVVEPAPKEVHVQTHTTSTQHQRPKPINKAMAPNPYYTFPRHTYSNSGQLTAKPLPPTPASSMTPSSASTSSSELPPTPPRPTISSSGRSQSERRRHRTTPLTPISYDSFSSFPDDVQILKPKKPAKNNHYYNESRRLGGDYGNSTSLGHDTIDEDKKKKAQTPKVERPKAPTPKPTPKTSPQRELPTPPLPMPTFSLPKPKPSPLSPKSDASGSTWDSSSVATTAKRTSNGTVPLYEVPASVTPGYDPPRAVLIHPGVTLSSISSPSETPVVPQPQSSGGGLVKVASSTSSTITASSSK